MVNVCSSECTHSFCSWHSYCMMSVTHQHKLHPVCHTSLILRNKLDAYIAGLVSYNF